MSFLKYIISSIILSLLSILPISLNSHINLFNLIFNIPILEDSSFISLTTLTISITLLFLNRPHTKKECITILPLLPSILPLIITNIFISYNILNYKILVTEILINLGLLLTIKKKKEIKIINYKNIFLISILLLTIKLANISTLLLIYLSLKNYYQKEKLQRYSFILYSITLLSTIKPFTWNYYYLPSIILTPLITTYFYKKNHKISKLIITEIIICVFTLFWLR